MVKNAYAHGLDRNAANYTPLTPVSFLAKAAAVYPERVAVIHGVVRRTWRETCERCRRLASALEKSGIRRGDTVAAILPNVPAMVELHFAPAMLGAVLNTLNTRLDAETIAFMLDHGEAKILFTDREFSATVARALALARSRPLVVDVHDALFPGERRSASASTRRSSRRAIPGSSGNSRPTSGTPSRSTTPRARRAIPRASSITTAALT